MSEAALTVCCYFRPFFVKSVTVLFIVNRLNVNYRIWNNFMLKLLTFMYYIFFFNPQDICLCVMCKACLSVMYYGEVIFQTKSNSENCKSSAAFSIL